MSWLNIFKAVAGKSFARTAAPTGETLSTLPRPTADRTLNEQAKELLNPKEGDVFEFCFKSSTHDFIDRDFFSSTPWSVDIQDTQVGNKGDHVVHLFYKNKELWVRLFNPMYGMCEQAFILCREFDIAVRRSPWLHLKFLCNTRTWTKLDNPADFKLYEDTAYRYVASSACGNDIYVHPSAVKSYTLAELDRLQKRKAEVEDIVNKEWEKHRESVKSELEEIEAIEASIKLLSAEKDLNKS